MAGEAIVELSTLRLPSSSRQAPKHSGFSYTKRWAHRWMLRPDVEGATFRGRSFAL